MSKINKSTLILLLSIIVLIVFIAFVMKPQKAYKEMNELIEQESASQSKAEIKKAETATWHKVTEWKGKSTKNTESFNVHSSEWRISWETNPGVYGDMNFQIFVYNSNNDLISVAANVIGNDKDSSIIRGTGTYYLQINTAQPYSIIIEEKY